MITYVVLPYLGVGVFLLLVVRMWFIPMVIEVASEEPYFWDDAREDANKQLKSDFSKDEVKEIVEKIVPRITWESVIYWVLLWPITMGRIFLEGRKFL